MFIGSSQETLTDVHTEIWCLNLTRIEKFSGLFMIVFFSYAKARLFNIMALEVLPPNISSFPKFCSCFYFLFQCRLINLIKCKVLGKSDIANTPC